MKLKKILQTTLALSTICATAAEARSRSAKAEFQVDRTKISGPHCNADNTFVLEEEDGFSILFTGMIIDLPQGNRTKDTKYCDIRIPMKVDRRSAAFAMKQTLTYGIQKSHHSFARLDVDAGIYSKSDMINKHFRYGELDIPVEQREFYIPYMDRGSRRRNKVCMDGHDFTSRGSSRTRYVSIRLMMDGKIESAENDYLFFATDGLDMRYRLQLETKRCERDD